MIAALRFRDFRDRGAAFVDAAILLPLLMMVVFGVIQLGYIIASYITLRNASAAGARVGIANSLMAKTPAARPTFNSMVAAAVTDSIAPLKPTIAVIPTPVVSGDTPPKVTVTVNYSLPLFPGSNLVLGQTGNFNMTSSTTMR